MKQYHHMHGTKSHNSDGLSTTHYHEKYVSAYGGVVLAVQHETTARYEGGKQTWYNTVVPGFVVKHRHKHDLSYVISIPKSYKRFTKYLLDKAGLRGRIEFQGK